MKRILISTLLLITFALVGHAQKMQPKAPPIIESAASYSETEIAMDKIAYNAAFTSGNYELAKQIRNEIGSKGRGSIAVTYGGFEASLMKGRAAWDVGLDILESGLTSLINITGRAGLSAALAFVKGGRGSVDKHFFQAQTTAILIQQMRAARLRIETRMDESQDLSVQEYPLGRVQADLADLFNAGTLPGGLMEASNQAGQNLESARQASSASRAARINAAQQQRLNDQQQQLSAPPKP